MENSLFRSRERLGDVYGHSTSLEMMRKRKKRREDVSGTEMPCYRDGIGRRVGLRMTGSTILLRQQHNSYVGIIDRW